MSKPNWELQQVGISWFIIDRNIEKLLNNEVVSKIWDEDIARMFLLAPEAIRLLKSIRSFIGTLPDDSMGHDPQDGYFYRDEMMDKIDDFMRDLKNEDITET